MRRGFAKKNVLIVLGVLMSLGLLIVGFLPTMLNLGLARGRIEGAIAQNLNGHVTIDELGLSWFGTQTISSLTILDEDANHVATLNLTLGESLVSLLRHGTRTLTLDLSGSMQMSVDEQGHLDVMSLLKPSAPDQPSALASMDSLSLKVQDFFVTLHDEKGKRDIEFSHLNGSTTYAPGQPLVATLQGDTTSGDLKGSVSLDLTMSDFLDHEGLVALQGASLNATLMANTVPMPLIETDGELRYLKVKLASPGLSDRLDVSIESEAVYEESQVSSLKGQFTLDHPYTEDGQLNIGLETLTGTLEGQRIPASLIQPLLANIHLVAERDFGSTLDLTAQFSTGQDKSVLVTVQASNFDFKVKGVIDASTRSMRGEFLSLSTTLAPELIATLANVKPDRAIPLSLELTRFTIPSLDKQGVFPLAELAATGSLQLDIDDSIMLAMLDSDAQDLSLSEFNVEFGTDRLADGVTLKGSSRGDFGHLILDEHITNLFDHEGSLQLANLLPEGTIRLVDLPGTRLARLIDDQSGVTKAMLSRPCTISLTSMASDEGLRFTFNFETHGVRAEVVAIRQPTKLVLETADVLVTLTPEVIELAQGELEQPIVLLEPVQATLALETQEFQGASWTDYDVMSAPLAFTLGLDALHLNQVPGLIEGVEVHAITSQLVTSLKPLTYKATGTFTLASSDASQKIAEVEFDVTSSSSRDNRPEGRIFFQKLKPVLIEQMLGRPKGNLSTWIGTWGKLTIDLSWSDESLHATLTPAFERLDGIFTATLDDQVINLSGQTSRFVIGAKAVNRLSRSIAAKSSASTTTSGQGRGNRRTRPSMRLVEDIPLTFDLKTLQIPLTALMGEKVNPDAFHLEAELKGQHMVLKTGSETIRFQDLHATVSGKSLANAIEFTLIANPVEADSSDSADARDLKGVNVKGSLSRLLDAERRLDTKHAQLQLNAQVARIPTLLIDALLNQGGQLVAAIGPTMQANFEANNFSSSSGTLKAHLQSDYGWLKASIRGVNETVQTFEGQPITAQLEISKSLREQLLYSLGPFLADIRSTEKPIDFTMSDAIIPLDGDISRLNANLEMDIGAVEYDSGSATLGLFRVFDINRGKTVPGYIDPVKMTIRNGIITYEQFNIKIDKFTLPFSGTIDLVKKEVHLRTAAPLAGLAISIKELDLVPNIQIPILVHGPFDDIKSEIDPDFDLGNILIDQGILKGLEGLLEGLDLGKIK